MKPPIHSLFPLSAILASVALAPLDAAVIDTTGGTTVLNFDAPQNTYTGNGTLQVSANGGDVKVELGTGPDNVATEFAMSGGLITIDSGVTLQNGGWQKGIWTSNNANMQVNGILDVWDGNTVRIDALTGAGAVTISSAPGVNWASNRFLVLGVNGGSGTFTGNINGNNTVNGGSLTVTKEGTGTQILTGTNTYNGTTTISGGTLKIGNGGTTGSLTASPQIINNAALAFNRSDDSSFAGVISGSGTLLKEGAGVLTLTADLTYSGNTTITGGTLKLVDQVPNSSGIIAIASGAAFDLNISTTRIALDGANVALGKLDGTTINGTGTFIKSGAGLLALDGQIGNHAVTFNMTGGTIDIQGGTLRNGGWDGGIWTTNKASMNIASGARFDIWGGQSPTVDALTGAGLVDSSSSGGSQTLTVGINNGSGTFSGTFQNTTGNLKLTKEGTGTQTFSGNNTFTGGTRVNGGRLVLVNNKTGSSNFITNAELEFNVTSGSQQLNGGTISGTGNLIKSGAGQLLLGANGSSQTVGMSSGSLIDVQGGILRNEFGNSAWGGNLADLNVASGAYLDLWDGNITVDAITGSGTINKAWSGTGTLTIGVDNGSGTFSGTISSLASPGGGYTGVGGGTLNLVKQGSGTQTLTGANTYTGATTISGGTLSIGATASLANTAVTVGGTTATGTPTLAGGGTIGGATIIAAAGGGAAGTHSPGIVGVANGVGTQSFSSTLDYGSGSIFEWNLNASGSADPGTAAANSGTYDQVSAAGAVTGGAAIFKVVLSGNNFTDAFWSTSKSWNTIFTGAGAPSSLAAVFSSFSSSGGLDATGLVAGIGQFSLNGSTSTLNWTPVPEPSSALAGLLVGAGLLRRRRN